MIVYARTKDEKLHKLKVKSPIKADSDVENELSKITDVPIKDYWEYAESCARMFTLEDLKNKLIKEGCYVNKGNFIYHVKPDDITIYEDQREGVPEGYRYHCIWHGKRGKYSTSGSFGINFGTYKDLFAFTREGLTSI